MTKCGAEVLDDIPSGFFVTDAARKVIAFNDYLVDQFDWPTDKAESLDFEAMMSPASRIFCDSFIYPLLLENGECQEAQLTFIGKEQERIPVVVNAKHRTNAQTIWSVSTARNRDRLFEELVNARTALEERARQLKELATTDELTGLLNRRACRSIAEKFFARASRLCSPVSIVLLDVDNFKRINDTYGHTVGDIVLREIAQGLQKTCRSNEIVARYGGEEFIVVMENATTCDALALCNRIHSHLTTVLRDTCLVTVSIGLSTRFGRYGPDFDELLTQADNALYQAKAQGKNRTVIGGNAREKIQTTNISPDQNSIAPRQSLNTNKGS